ncbi:Asp23/Gls24 family envelope stress response protein [Streptomyces hainanensis]|uniref:Asp23/Gls24 family envelope stress response protein n=1 Tax=Streptomyces hainanensis TaxID=402648 RepID=A0A4R4T9Q1_9ACTN|nr:Asp23/Gls24 family envelope stress response protein [Streptomyces hainanensis]TDC72204.1 Asp23/Gls24 family envelope stress response protein [Streptomyces hainanensis]
METSVPAAERGATRISERVVAKLAAQAAREALGEPGELPQATAVVRRSSDPSGSGVLASVSVEVELGYPCDIGARCRQVRRQVELRVRELAGMETTDVAVAVGRLRSAHLAAASGGREGNRNGSGRVR